MRGAILAIALVLSPLAARAAEPEPCRFSVEDGDWAEAAMAIWAQARDDLLGLSKAEEPPRLILFDIRCTFTVDADPWRAAEHDGVSITLPDGTTTEVAGGEPIVASFDNGAKIYLAVPLPSLWATDPADQEFGQDKRMFATFIRAMTRTRLSPEPRASVGPVGADVPAEIERLHQAAAAPTDAAARDLARQALALIETRRRAPPADNAAEDARLLRDGASAWAGYAWLIWPNGGEVAPDIALRGARFATADIGAEEGLALYLAIDRLAPGWKARTFAAPTPASPLALLAEAVR